MFGPSDQFPLRGKGGAAGTKGGAFPRPLGRLYGFLNEYVIPLSFRKIHNLASLVEMHPLYKENSCYPSQYYM